MCKMQCLKCNMKDWMCKMQCLQCNMEDAMRKIQFIRCNVLSVLSFLQTIKKGSPFLGRGHRGHWRPFYFSAYYSLYLYIYVLEISRIGLDISQFKYHSILEDSGGRGKQWTPHFGLTYQSIVQPARHSACFAD